MSRFFRGMLLAALGAWAIWPVEASSPPQANADVVFEGSAENRTVGETARIRLSLRQNGDRLEGRLETSEPLPATGRVKGWVRDGMCRLGGRMEEGFYLEILGNCSKTSYSGEYVIAFSVNDRQEGHFALTAVSGALVEGRPRGNGGAKR